MISDIEKEDIATANYKDGFDEGMEKGMEKGKAKVAKKMLERGFSPEEIAECTGIREEDIKAL